MVENVISSSKRQLSFLDFFRIIFRYKKTFITTTILATATFILFATTLKSKQYYFIQPLQLGYYLKVDQKQFFEQGNYVVDQLKNNFLSSALQQYQDEQHIYVPYTQYTINENNPYSVDVVNYKDPYPTGIIYIKFSGNRQMLLAFKTINQKILKQILSQEEDYFKSFKERLSFNISSLQTQINNVKLAQSNLRKHLQSSDNSSLNMYLAGSSSVQLESLLIDLQDNLFDKQQMLASLQPASLGTLNLVDTQTLSVKQLILAAFILGLISATLLVLTINFIKDIRVKN